MIRKSQINYCIRRYLRPATAIIIIMMALFSTDCVCGKKIKQSLKVIKRENSKNDSCQANTGHTIDIDIDKSDSITFIKDGKPCLFISKSIRFAGYDKTLNSSKESFHVVNESEIDIKGMTIRLTYKDMSDRMLHSRKITVEEEIPHGETRKIDVSSWDTQKTFYYYRSNPPKRDAAPYKITLTLLSIEIYTN